MLLRWFQVLLTQHMTATPKPATAILMQAP